MRFDAFTEMARLRWRSKYRLYRVNRAINVVMRGREWTPREIMLIELPEYGVFENVRYIESPVEPTDARPAQALWAFVHNCIAHPLLFLTWNAAWAVRFHDWSSHKMHQRFPKLYIKNPEYLTR